MLSRYLQVAAWSSNKNFCFKKVPKSSAIKVIDFGSTVYESRDQDYTVSTRHYPAPEVILGKAMIAFLYFNLIMLLGLMYEKIDNH